MTYGVGAYGAGALGGIPGIIAEPTVSAQFPADITPTTATLKGTLIADGGDPVTEWGFYYMIGSTGDPTSADTVVSSTGVLAAGPYTEAITGLSDGTDYRVAPFATNSVGTAVGATIGFTAGELPIVTTGAAEEIFSSTAELNGNILDVGHDDCIERGFYYLLGTSGDPDASDFIVKSTGTFTAGDFTEDPTGLTENSAYRFAAFATNSIGTSIGTTQTFTTGYVKPTMTTQAVTNILATTATFNGTIVVEGDTACTTRGFYYLQGSSGDPTAADSTLSESGTFIEEAYSLDATGLTKALPYRVAAFATNSGGTTIGTTVDVTMYDEPTVTTQAVSDIAGDTATLNGNITDTGGLNITRRGFYYKLGSSGDPTAADEVIYADGDFGTGAFLENISGLTDSSDYRVATFVTNPTGTFVGSTVGLTTVDDKIVVPGTTGPMSVTLTPLEPSTLYYVRSFATNSEGTAYGTETSFTTGPDGRPITTFMDGGASA